MAIHECHRSTVTGSQVCTGNPKFLTLQQLINQIAQAKGIPTIDEDGEIGPDTVRAFNQVTGFSSSAENLANTVDDAIGALQNTADESGIPRPPTQAGMLGGKTNWWLWIGVGAVAVAGVYLAVKKGYVKSPKLLFPKRKIA